jgi:uncharacterized protein YecT (DUF1311 family)
MKQILTSLLFFACLTGFSQTQAEMNTNAKDSYQKTDAELNSVYQKIMIKNKSDTAFIKNLRASQKIWIKFRDAELKVRFPDREPEYYGSMYPMCVSMYLEGLTKERIATLKKFLDGSIGNDGCN